MEDGENELEIALELVKEKKLRGIIFLGGSFIHPPALLKRLTVPYVISTIGQQENPEGISEEACRWTTGRKAVRP